MEDKEINVPLFLHESSMVRMERTIRRLVICLILCIVLLFGCNIAWLYAWNQYEYVGGVDTTYEQDGEGNNVIGNGNEVNQ